MRRLFVLLAFLFAWPALAAVNINTADQTELETLPGIGESKAVAIIQYRTDNGPFTSVDDLDNVSGIGASTLANLRDLVTVGGAAAAAPGGASSAGTAATTATSPTATAPPPVACSVVNINTADAAALDGLPGIGPSKAAAILQYRADNGKFASCDGLDAVSGIGPSTLAGLRDCCTVK